MGGRALHLITVQQSLCHCHCHSYSNSPSQSVTQLIHFSTQNLENKININGFEFTKLPEFRKSKVKSAGPLILRIHNFGFPFCFIHVWGEAIIYEDIRIFQNQIFLPKSAWGFFLIFCWFISHRMDIQLGDWKELRSQLLFSQSLIISRRKLSALCLLPHYLSY